MNEQNWRVLRLLQEEGPLELRQTAQEACLRLSSQRRMIGRMEADGRIRRHKRPEDRRKSVIALAEANSRLNGDRAETGAEVFDRVQARMGPRTGGADA